MVPHAHRLDPRFGGAISPSVPFDRAIGPGVIVVELAASPRLVKFTLHDRETTGAVSDRAGRSLCVNLTASRGQTVNACESVPE